MRNLSAKDGLPHIPVVGRLQQRRGAVQAQGCVELFTGMDAGVKTSKFHQKFAGCAVLFVGFID
jgi:hypothetical protein